MSERIFAEKTSHDSSRHPAGFEIESQQERFGEIDHTRIRAETERSPFRTVLPPEAPIVSGADSLRAVTDNVTHNIAEVRVAIEKNMAEALKLERRLEYLLKLEAVAEEYKNGK